MNAIQLLFDSNRGIYIPQAFAADIDTSKFDGIDADDLRTLQLGPEDESYWDAWASILDNAEFKKDGNTWRLHQDGDLFMVCDELMTDDEYESFYGEARWHDNTMPGDYDRDVY